MLEGRARDLGCFECEIVCLLRRDQSVGSWSEERRRVRIAAVACRSEVMTGCLLLGASYALLATPTHAVGAVAAVGAEDNKVRARSRCSRWSHGWSEESGITDARPG